MDRILVFIYFCDFYDFIYFFRFLCFFVVTMLASAHESGEVTRTALSRRFASLDFVVRCENR